MLLFIFSLEDPDFPVMDGRMYFSKFTDSFVCNNPKAGSTLWRDRAGLMMKGGLGHTYAKPLDMMGEHNDTYKGKERTIKLILGGVLHP